MFGMFPCILFLAAFAYAMGTTPPSFGLLRMLINKFEFKPQHCGDILRAGGATSGVYTLFHDAAGPWGQRVYCDMDTDGGGWTVIQRRGQYGNNAYYFYRNWTEYARGFGDPAQEYWIGNRALHALTSGKETMTLRVVLINSTKDSQAVDYESVGVGSEEELFEMKLGKFLGPTGWDAFGYHSGNMFSTLGRDNDVDDGSCAIKFQGAWWYYNCHISNLNGLNLKGHHSSYANGIDWSVKDGHTGLYYHSYPIVRMMIRPARCT
ncbi:ficolin-1-like isoform X2 [Amblyomma americanum]